MNFLRKTHFVLLSFLCVVCSCIPLKDLNYIQKSPNTKINNEGIIETNKTDYHFHIDDILSLNIISRDPNVSNLFGPQVTSTISSAGEALFYISGLTVNSFGEIEIPILGRIKVENKTAEEVKMILENKLRETYKESAFTVKVQLSGIYYTILGDVNGPGTRVIYRNRLNILEAIANAGDLAVTAKRKKIKLYREFPEGKKMVMIDLTKDNLINSEYFYVQPNDIFIVDARWQKTWGIGINTIGTIATTFSIFSGAVATYFTIKALSEQ
jgi:polysaccharide biosynthesis/export protein